MPFARLALLPAPFHMLLAPGADEPAGADNPRADAPASNPVSGSLAGSVIDLQIERELKDSYLTYAMSTIMDRALPDVRDGLKPSQRRILVAMNDLGLRPGKKHIKCAKITGDTSGNYHPHGEAVIYPTLVNMAQKWKMRVPLIDPQGNFGSIDPDPPAAQRYTEARMTHAAVEMLADLELSTVGEQPNYDDRLTEPTVLPGKFPNLLINGTVGIAVGMATSLPPHNPAEILDAIVRVIEHPEISLGELMQDEPEAQARAANREPRLGVKGPDFPTGGIIRGRGGIIDAYSTGRGKVTIRGRCHIEEIGKDRQQIVIDQIPYMLGQRTLVESIVEAVKTDKITEVSDVRNESGREAQTRVVIELKKGGDAAVIENQLYQFTPLQQTFSIMNIALVNRQPRTLGLKELLEQYILHREEVIRRRTMHLLRAAKQEAHKLEGLIYAVCDIDEVIRLIRSSATREQAIVKLMEHQFRIAPAHAHYAKLPARLKTMLAAAERTGGISLSRIQAEAIGQLQLIRLVGLEIDKLVGDYTAVVGEIEGYEAILGDRGKVLGIIKDDCAAMRARFGTGKPAQRLTSIEDAGDDINIEALIREEEMVVTISHSGYAKRVPLDTYKQQGRGGKGIKASEAKDDDFIEHLFVASTHADLLCFTDTGRVFKIKVYELPEMTRTAKGRPIINLIDLKSGERACAYLAIRNFEAGSDYLTFVSRGGIVKRTALKDYRNVNKSGIIAVGLKDDDHLLDVTVTDGNDDLLLVTADGMAIRFNEQDVRLMGRSAAGVKGITLRGRESEEDEPGESVKPPAPASPAAAVDSDEVIGVIPIGMNPDAEGDLMTADPSICLLTVTERGFGKRTPVDEYRVQPETGKMRSQTRGGKGRADIDTASTRGAVGKGAKGMSNGRSVAAIAVHERDDVVVITKQGKLVRMPSGEIRQCGRGTKGVKVVGLDEGDEVVAVTRVAETDADTSAIEPPKPE
jgi:DNA gyrase subunit A